MKSLFMVFSTAPSRHTRDLLKANPELNPESIQDCSRSPKGDFRTAYGEKGGLEIFQPLNSLPIEK